MFLRLLFTKVIMPVWLIGIFVLVIVYVRRYGVTPKDIDENWLWSDFVGDIIIALTWPISMTIPKYRKIYFGPRNPET